MKPSQECAVYFFRRSGGQRQHHPHRQRILPGDHRALIQHVVPDKGTSPALTDTVSGVVNGKRWDDWGLHLLDVNIAMGNLLELVRLQGAAFLATPK